MSHNPVLLLDISKADSIMENLVFGPNILQNWHVINSCRLVLIKFLIFKVIFTY